MQQNIGVSKTPELKENQISSKTPSTKPKIHMKDFKTTTFMSFSGQVFRGQLHHLGASYNLP